MANAEPRRRMRVARAHVPAWCLGGLLLLTGACATGSGGMAGLVLRQPVDTPPRFEVPPEPPGTVPGANCRSPLTDGRDGTEIVMQRAAGGLADYSVQAGRYGVTAGELLRVRCLTGEPVGIVRR
jgi:hypothetical protein